MGDHLDKIPRAVLLGKSGWRSGHKSRLPPPLLTLTVTTNVEGDIGVCGIAVLVNFSCSISVILILNCVIAVFSESAG